MTTDKQAAAKHRERSRRERVDLTITVTGHSSIRVAPHEYRSGVWISSDEWNDLRHEMRDLLAVRDAAAQWRTDGYQPGGPAMDADLNGALDAYKEGQNDYR